MKYSLKVHPRILCYNHWVAAIILQEDTIMPLLQPKETYFTAEDYYNTSEEDRVELIKGEFYDMASPSTTHQIISGELFTEINMYIRGNSGNCRVFSAPFDVQPDENDDRTVVVPDISVICDREKLSERGCKGAPDWIIEIASPGNMSLDYIKKVSIYKRAGVRLYWIVNPMEAKVGVFDFGNGKDIPEEYSFDDIIKVSIYDDLSIDFKKIKDSLIS